MRVVDEPHVSVDWDEDISTLVLVWKAKCNSTQLRDCVTRALDTFRERGSTRWITDATVQWHSSEEDNNWIYRDVFGALVQAGLKRFGLVRSPDDLAAFDFSPLVQGAARVGVELKLFSELAAARAWITTASSPPITPPENRPVATSKTVGIVTEMTLINPIKPGHVQQLRQALAYVGQNVALVRKMETIHFARWVIIDNDTRLLFTSNFDHSWERYLRDFMNVMPDGLDLIWSNCVDYPGCRPYEPFAAWVSKYQIETTLFFAAYPTATVKDVIQALDWKAKADKFQEALATPPADTVGQVN